MIVQNIQNIMITNYLKEKEYKNVYDMIKKFIKFCKKILYLGIQLKKKNGKNKAYLEL